MIPQVLINVYGIRLTARLSDFSVWWHVGGVLVIVLALALLGAHVTTASPLEASSADLGGGRTAPALVVADYKVPSTALCAGAGAARALRRRTGGARVRARSAPGAVDLHRL
jgi:amino acid transporter